MRILYTADIHGHSGQYRILFDSAIREGVDIIIVGGDLLPKDRNGRTPFLQQQYFSSEMLPLIQRFYDDYFMAYGRVCKLYLLLGNDDFRAVIPCMNDNQQQLFQLMYNHNLSIIDDYRLIGYSYVGFTPFIYKDWERADLDCENERVTRPDTKWQGIIMHLNGSQTDINLEPTNRTDTIESNLNNLMKSIGVGRTILVTHAPPYNTNLDMISPTKHVGSRAVRKIIERYQPIVSLHGHIHESPLISGSIRDRIGNTICVNPGNNYLQDQPKMVMIKITSKGIPEIAEYLYQRTK